MYMYLFNVNFLNKIKIYSYIYIAVVISLICDLTFRVFSNFKRSNVLMVYGIIVCYLSMEKGGQITED
jgi:hypothetical protein